MATESALITLVLGGARSGKSEVAERRAAAAPPVTYLAAGPAPAADDPSWVQRVAAHRARRPADWSTLEVTPGGPLDAALASLEGTALVDSVGPWLSGVPGFGLGPGGPAADAVLEALARRRAGGWGTVLVSDEVGLGVHPATPAGNEFRDGLGALNRRIADLADEVLLVLAGRVLPLPRSLEGPGPAAPPASPTAPAL